MTSFAYKQARHEKRYKGVDKINQPVYAFLTQLWLNPEYFRTLKKKKGGGGNG